MEDVVNDMPPDAVAAGDEAFPDLPVVVVGTDELVTANESIPPLAKQPNVYQRGGKLVHVVRDPVRAKGVALSPNAPRIVEMPRPRVRELLSHCIEFKAWRKKRDGSGESELVKTRVPQEIVSALHARGQWDEIPVLGAITETPVLRADGSVLDVPGYDTATALIYEPNAEFPKIPAKPTKGDARRALDLLADVVCDFPFAEPSHRAEWLALALTPFARPAFDGCTPLGLVEKNVRGAGGTMLCELVGAIYSGRPLARMSQADDTETRKRITTIAMSGAPVVLIDNVVGALGGPALESALTAPVWSDRELGVNRDVTLPLRCLWLVSGNNPAVSSDLVRRILSIRLESPMERPEERSGFRHPDLLAHVYANRPALVAAAVTTLRAYFCAGCPDQSLAPWGSFEAWSRLVRGALVWAGEPDPYLGRKELIETGDRDVDLLERLLVGWEEFSEPVTTVEALARLRKAQALYGTLRDALSDALGPADKLTPKRVGYFLRKHKRRVVGDRYFDHKPKVGTGTPWFVHHVRVSDDRVDGDDPPHTPRESVEKQDQSGSGNHRHNGHDRHYDGDVERWALQHEGEL